MTMAMTTQEHDLSPEEIGEAIAACEIACAASLVVLRAGAGGSTALMLLTLGAASNAARHAANLLACLDAPEVPPVERAATGCKRHVFADGKCAKCGKVKSANGRKPAGAADAPPVDTRTGRLPLGDGVADKFTDGAQGSSGMRR